MKRKTFPFYLARYGHGSFITDKKLRVAEYSYRGFNTFEAAKKALIKEVTECQARDALAYGRAIAQAMNLEPGDVE